MSQPILVIDDDPLIVDLVRDILEFEGYTVVSAANGQEGLSLLDQAQPALVLLDMRMPVLDGWGFARVLQERGTVLPIVVMTAAQDAKQWAAEIGATSYVAKPFEFDDLMQAVQALHRG